MDNLFASIKNKPPIFLLITLLYLLGIGLLKWGLNPSVGSIWFLVGGALGVYFLDGAEIFFHLTPSPFRSIVFVGGFAMVSFFVVTSSGSLLATGLVFSLYVMLILWQINEWKRLKNLDSWYQLICGTVAPTVQRWILVGFIGLLCIETYLFIR